MSKTVIKVESISKRYRLGLKEKTADTFIGAVANMVKSPWENFKRLRSLSHFNADDESVFWALKDVSFEVKEGEVLGVIGKNGAGKSTLLKILSQITEPTSGQIEIAGRVASLLEVGTGFHPELTGRENIYMNGTILGMTKKEIDRKLDEIIDFSGVEKFVDTPVKFYSSGMKVRLGFSVAAHLEPEILIIDEVLAVGDYEFQKKCLGKMEDVAGHGRTVLFVSHNMAAIRQLCHNAILLNAGTVETSGPVEQVVEKYFQKGFQLKERPEIGAYRSYDNSNSPVVIKDIFLLGKEDHFPTLALGEEPTLVIRVEVSNPVQNANMTVILYNSEGVNLGLAFSWDDNFYLNADTGLHHIFVRLKGVRFTPGHYLVGVGINQSTSTVAWDGINFYPLYKIQDESNLRHFTHRPWGINHFVDNVWEIKRV